MEQAGGRVVPVYFRGARREAEHGVRALRHECTCLELMAKHGLPVPRVFGFCPDPEGIVINDEDLFNIMYSSGTTGLPKGIVHTHFIRAMYGALFASSFRMTPESVTMHAGAIVFNGSFVDLMPTMFIGATYILLPQFDPVTYIEKVEQEKVTHVILVPAQIIALLNAPNFSVEALKSLEMIQ